MKTTSYAQAYISTELDILEASQQDYCFPYGESLITLDPFPGGTPENYSILKKFWLVDFSTKKNKFSLWE